MSGFKSKLKNKNWELVQPNQVADNFSNNTSFLDDQKSKISDMFECDINSINDSKTTSRQSSFDEELYLIKAEIEFKRKAKEMTMSLISLEGFLRLVHMKLN
jgi:hypothetical protein